MTAPRGAEATPPASRTRAARRNAMTMEELRGRIQSGRIVDRLQNHIDAASKGKKAYMTESQVRAALGLLKKVLPDLAALTLEGGDPGNPVRFVIEGLEPVTK